MVESVASKTVLAPHPAAGAGIIGVDVFSLQYLFTLGYPFVMYFSNKVV
jgi:hypothetical protein